MALKGEAARWKAFLAGGRVSAPAADESVLNDEESERVRRAVGECLTDREAAVVIARYWGGETLEYAGRIAGVSRERARQILLKSERKLRRWLGSAMDGDDGREKVCVELSEVGLFLQRVPGKGCRVCYKSGFLAIASRGRLHKASCPGLGAAAEARREGWERAFEIAIAALRNALPELPSSLSVWFSAAGSGIEPRFAGRGGK